MQYTWSCIKCKSIKTIERPMVRYNDPPEECEHCAANEGWERVIEAPAIRTGDGYKG